MAQSYRNSLPITSDPQSQLRAAENLAAAVVLADRRDNGGGMW
jgi:hypothetical protein